MSSFCLLLIAFLINPSEEMNSVYMRSAPLSLHTERKGGSLTSSIGASKSGKGGSCILPIVTKSILYFDYLKSDSWFPGYLSGQASKAWKKRKFTHF
jgi:hypothetical protein